MSVTGRGIKLSRGRRAVLVGPCAALVFGSPASRMLAASRLLIMPRQLAARRATRLANPSRCVKETVLMTRIPCCGM